MNSVRGSQKEPLRGGRKHPRANLARQGVAEGDIEKIFVSFKASFVVGGVVEGMCVSAMTRVAMRCVWGGSLKRKS